MKSRIVVANWKMNPSTAKAAQSLFAATVAAAARLRSVEVVVCPPAPYVPLLRGKYRGKRIAFGAQDISAHEVGSFTGEISAAMVHDMGARYVIVGHSERRRAGETDEVIGQKVARALTSDLSPIICIGESQRDDQGQYLHDLRAQMKMALSGVRASDLKRALVAYEPVWAIGKRAEDALSPNAMHEMVLYVRKLLSEKYGLAAAREVAVLYGGSVEVTNAEAMLTRGEVDGLLVGHASLEAKPFAEILSITSRVASAK